MKNVLSAVFSFFLFPLLAQAEFLSCRRVIEVEGKVDVYQVAPRIVTRIPIMTFNTGRKEVRYDRQVTGSRVSIKKVPYTILPPSEELEGPSLSFTTEKGIAILNFDQKLTGRYLGSSKEYLVGEFFEEDLDSNSWTYFCPKEILQELPNDVQVVR